MQPRRPGWRRRRPSREGNPAKDARDSPHQAALRINKEAMAGLSGAFQGFPEEGNQMSRK
jgi:hypothetical protein